MKRIPATNPHPQRAADVAGGQSELARKLAANITPQAVGAWCRTGRIPAERVIEVERLTGVSRHDLRPDIYPLESPASLAAAG